MNIAAGAGGLRGSRVTPAGFRSMPDYTMDAPRTLHGTAHSFSLHNTKVCMALQCNGAHAQPTCIMTLHCSKAHSLEPSL